MSDPLSEALRSVRLDGAVFLDVSLTEPFALNSSFTSEDCRAMLADPKQLIFYHVVLEGRIFVEVEGEAPVEVRAGEIVILPRNDMHLVASGGARPRSVSSLSLIRPGPDGGLMRIDHGGGGAAMHMVCGFLGSARGVNPLIAALPRVLKIGLADAAQRDWVEATVRLAARQVAAGRLPGAAMAVRLSEALLIEAVRTHAEAGGAAAAGWLRGFADPQIARALALIHGDLGRERSVEELAAAAALSRSAFVARFTALVGVPPMRHVAAWRLAAAQQRLRETRDAIAQIAHEVGYGSPEAFSRAFRRETGQSPAAWREAARV